MYSWGYNPLIRSPLILTNPTGHPSAQTLSLQIVFWVHQGLVLKCVLISFHYPIGNVSKKRIPLSYIERKALVVSEISQPSKHYESPKV